MRALRVQMRALSVHRPLRAQRGTRLRGAHGAQHGCPRPARGRQRERQQEDGEQASYQQGS